MVHKEEVGGNDIRFTYSFQVNKFIDQNSDSKEVKRTYLDKDKRVSREN